LPELFHILKRESRIGKAVPPLNDLGIEKRAISEVDIGKQASVPISPLGIVIAFQANHFPLGGKGSFSLSAEGETHDLRRAARKHGRLVSGVPSSPHFGGDTGFLRSDPPSCPFQPAMRLITGRPQAAAPGFSLTSS